MTEAQKEEFKSLSSQLSPENLNCDGEITRAQAQTKYRRIMKRWRALEKALGREVSEDEAWGFYKPTITMYSVKRASPTGLK